jgi:hypothetical protein
VIRLQTCTTSAKVDSNSDKARTAFRGTGFFLRNAENHTNRPMYLFSSVGRRDRTECEASTVGRAVNGRQPSSVADHCPPKGLALDDRLSTG